ncbi:beta-N-acetylhexosaminidase [Kutzneria sp. 744]|uniref:beta-N-acetylhexosaminidase n=1 Tax=Kutzneria sp. (strain 744) TaxID=345341 RepID=UPI0003EEDEC6|nr:beta-N-acetylhexosaminidase [Kutzneria sp. 744]EWM10777.1 beta-N-acetylhexosaminidase [Kutzneria sp. 744]
MIIPSPHHVEPRPGAFPLHPGRRISCAPGAERAGELLAGYLGLRGANGSAPSIWLELASRGPGPEGYQLDIRPQQVHLTATTETGLLHGVQTLRSLVSGNRLPCLRIRDAPRLPWRGVLLDVARHHMPLEFLHQFVDVMALHKLNVLHLHLTDDQGWRMEIAGWPRLVDVGAWRPESMIGPAGSGEFDGMPHGGYYTQAELRELVRCAAARGVMIVPEIEMPGHVRAALAAYPELGNFPERRLQVWTSWGISEDILGVHDTALAFCRDVLRQVANVFPAPYVHIGGDECPTTQWSNAPSALARAAELGFDDPGRLHGWFLGQMADTLRELGRTAVCWAETGQHAGGMPAGTVVTAWRDAAHGASAIADGHQVIMAPHRSTYLDYRPEEPAGHSGIVTTVADVYGFDPLAGGLPVAAGSRPGVLGAQAQLWTELAPTPDHVRRLAFPRLCAFADTAWRTTAPDYDEFRRRLAVHMDLLDALNALPTTCAETTP